jgi:hypothetical protein
MTKEMQKIFTSGISIVCGGSILENVRCALRFLLYLPGVLGVGGLIAGSFLFAGKRDEYRTIALIGLLPFFLAGIILYMPLPQYYAPIASFAIALAIFTGKLPSSMPLKALCIAGNLLLFWLMAPPMQTTGSFYDRDLMHNVKKQLSYIGANSAAVLRTNNELLRTAEVTCGTCKSFYSPLLWDRIWTYMAEKRWHNHYTPNADSADCLFILSDSTDYSRRGINRTIRFERRQP